MHPYIEERIAGLGLQCVLPMKGVAISLTGGNTGNVIGSSLVTMGIDAVNVPYALLRAAVFKKEVLPSS